MRARFPSSSAAHELFFFVLFLFDVHASLSLFLLSLCPTPDPKIIYLGVIQSFFEGAMYIFVFMWTPALEATSPWTEQLISHGWIFACFMVGWRG